MKILKFFLSLTLILCACWGLAVTFGPSLLKKVVTNLYGEHIKLNLVEIKPNLEIHFGNVELVTNTSAEAANPLGISRSIDIGWNIFKSDSAVSISLGRTSFGNVVFDAAKIHLSREGFFRFDYTPVKAHFNNFELAECCLVSELNLNGNWYNSHRNLQGILFSMTDIFHSGYPSFSAETVEGSIDKIFLQKNLRSQFNSGDATIKSIAFNNDSIQIPTAMVEIDNSSGLLTSVLSFNNFSDFTRDINFDGLDLSLNYSLLDNPETFSVEFNLDKLSGFNEKFSVERIFGGMKKVSNDLTLKLNGEALSMLLEKDDKFVAKLENGDFETSSTIEIFEKEVNVYANTIGFVPTRPIVEAEMKNTINFTKVSDIHKCINSECYLRDATAIYSVKIDGNKLSGTVGCNIQNCQLNDLKHIIQTSNTSELFQSFLKTEIVNPLVLGLLYGQLLSGKKQSKGHKLEF